MSQVEFCATLRASDSWRDTPPAPRTSLPETSCPEVGVCVYICVFVCGCIYMSMFARNTLFIFVCYVTTTDDDEHCVFCVDYMYVQP